MNTQREPTGLSTQHTVQRLVHARIYPITNKNTEMVMDRVYGVRNPLNDKQYCQQSHLYLCINTGPKSGGPARLKKEAPQTESINSVN